MGLTCQDGVARCSSCGSPGWCEMSDDGKAIRFGCTNCDYEATVPILMGADGKTRTDPIQDEAS